MELIHLKSTWSKYSSAEVNRHQLNETDLHDLLSKRTKTLIERIDRNMKIGFAVLILLTLFFLIDDFLLTPFLSASNDVVIPNWIVWINGIKTTFILLTFIYFGIRYHSAKRGYNQSNNLKQVLNSIIQILHTYQKLFYMALAILLLVLSISYITGMFIGIEDAAIRQGVSIKELNQDQIIKHLGGGLLLLISIIGILFFFFRWGFQKLYGKYISQLEATLQELEEVD